MTLVVNNKPTLFLFPMKAQGIGVECRGMNHLDCVKIPVKNDDEPPPSVPGGNRFVCALETVT